MNAYRKLSTLFTVALAATVLCVGSAFTQAIDIVEAEGKFTLPFEAHWGTATLPAGQYSFEGGRTSGGTQLTKVSGEGKASRQALILNIGQSLSPSADTSELVCIRHGNTGTVQALVLTSLGETLYFPMPKNERLLAQTRRGKTRTLLAQGPELIQRIRVEATGR